MRRISYIAGAAALAMALAGCGEPYYPGYGRTQSYSSPSGYSYAPSDSAYVPASNSSYSSRSDYYRNYNGIHAAPERTFP
jgi:hypothetical protein